MKKYKILLCSLLLILGTAGVLYAFSFTDERQVNRWLSTGESVFLDFNYDQSVQVDRVSIDFEDDGDRQNEYSSLDINQTRLANFEVNDGTMSWNLNSLQKFNLNVLDRRGTFCVKRIAIFGNFIERPPTSVPEPGDMLTLGFVLLGLIAVSRKRFKERN